MRVKYVCARASLHVSGRPHIQRVCITHAFELLDVCLFACFYANKIEITQIQGFHTHERTIDGLTDEQTKCLINTQEPIEKV